MNLPIREYIASQHDLGGENIMGIKKFNLPRSQFRTRGRLVL